MVIYEQILDHDLRRAMSESSRFFEERSAVQDALRKITLRLRGMNIGYAVAGGMALFFHGFRRFTEDIDILVRPEDLGKIHAELEGLGYVRAFAGSKNLRDAETGVRIEFLISGHYPGDGKPKPVMFPRPVDVAVERDGIAYLNLPTLIELKLASGMTNADRVKDLADVQELIKLLALPENFAGQIAEYVRTKYGELWTAAHPATRYLLLWRKKSSAIEAQSPEEMVADLRPAASMLEAMLADGAMVDPDRGTGDDYVYLVTTDPELARKYGMHEESEYWDVELPEREGETD